MKSNKPNHTRLLRILEVMRPSGTNAEDAFVNHFLLPLINELARAPAAKDQYGNVWIELKNPDNTRAITMFSSHTDTVHRHEGRQELAYDSAKFHIFPSDPMKSGCLGADDGTGIWLMLHMIENGVPGMYIFHRDEEVGGGGSSFIAKHHADKLAHIKHCVAFDRKGYTDIITHQGATCTSSDEFAGALAKHLPGFSACDGGSFTDSKNYRGIIAECTNLAVGYFNQHTVKEYQDVKFAVQLARQLCAVPWDQLPAARTPIIETYAHTYTGRAADAPWWESYVGSGTKKPVATKKYNDTVPTNDLLKWVREQPLAAAYLLNALEVDTNDLLDAEEDARYFNRPVVVQRPDNVREVPAGGEEKVSGQTTGTTTG